MSGATCYYPNGDVSANDIPCGDGDAVACCPQGWTCEPNGLCHLANPFYYGRYTCTDKNWGQGCPNICTHGGTAAGDEAVLECSSGNYCCDGNRPELSSDNSVDQSKDCCHTSNDRFSLAQLPLAPGGSEDSNGSAASSSSTSSASPSAAQTSSSSSSSASSSTSESPSTSASSSTASPTLRSMTLDTSSSASSETNSPVTKVVTSVVSASGGGSSTFVTTTSNPGSAVPASQTGVASPTPSSSNSKNLGPIVGPAVAVPVAVLLLAALALFLFLRRRRRNQNRASSPPPMGDNIQPMYGNDAKDLVDSPYTGKSELEGSPNIPTVTPGTPGNGNKTGFHTPNDVGAGGVRDSKSELAASNSTSTKNTRSRLSELQGSPTVAHHDEAETQPAELQGNEAQSNTYKPYRPSGLGLTER